MVVPVAVWRVGQFSRWTRWSEGSRDMHHRAELMQASRSLNHHVICHPTLLLFIVFGPTEVHVGPGCCDASS